MYATERNISNLERNKLLHSFILTGYSSYFNCRVSQSEA